jgi:hypothetical protein
MDPFTTAELEAIAHSVQEDLGVVRRLIRMGVEAQVLGRTVEHTYVEDADHAGGFDRITVLATVVGTRWTYDNEIILEVTYTHPTTGEALVGDCPMW